MRFQVMYELDRDWELVVQSRRAHQALTRWRTDPVLGDLACLTDILIRTRRSVGPAAADRVLAALAARAGADPIAARALLQALMPGMVRLAHRHSAGGRVDAASDVVGYAVERIRTYPFERRPRAIAANVLLDVHQWMCRDRRKEPDTVGWTSYAEDRVAARGDTAEPADVIVELVGDAVAGGALSPADAAMILAPVLGYSDDVVAGSLAGIKPKSIARRRQRVAERFVAFHKEQALA